MGGVFCKLGPSEPEDEQPAQKTYSWYVRMHVYVYVCMCVCVALFLSPLSLFKRIVSLCQPQGYARNKGSQPVSIQGSQRVCAAQIQTKTGHTYSLTSSLTQSRTHSLTHVLTHSLTHSRSSA